MRKIKFALAVILVTLGFSSCEEDLDFFSDDLRESFLGEWSVKEENTLKSTDYYIVKIENSESDSTAVLISNFYSIGDDFAVEGVVSGSRITIPTQTVSGFTFQGYGTITLSGKIINWSYNVDFNNGTTDSATAIFTKQD